MSELRRDIGLWRGIALNMIDMVGIGPFITIPLILAAMGGGRGMLAWILGGLLAISDGLVTAELSAEMPASGGSYVFLREAYGRAGRLISFLFLFQILFSAPLSMASGCIGFANYLKILMPAAEGHVAITAMIICVLTTLILLRKLEAIGKLSVLLWVGVMGTLAIVIVAGLPHGQARRAVDLDSDSLDRVRVDLLADARLFADPLRGGPRWKLLPHLLQAARHRSASLRGHDFSWQRCRGLLLASSDACAAGHPLHPVHHSVHGPDRRRGDLARAATRPPPPVPHVALSAAGDHRSGAVVLHRHFAAERI